MAVLTSDLWLESVKADIDDVAAGTQTLTTTWRARRLSDGQLFDVQVVSAISDPSTFLDQAFWDVVFASAATGMATAAGGSASAVNPVSV